MRVKFLKDWQGEGSASFKKDEITEIDEDLAWTLAMQGYVLLKKPITPEVENEKHRYRDQRKKKK